MLEKYYEPLKETFLAIAATSAWPNVGQLDFCDFATKARFLDAAVNISCVDRSFIAANLKVADVATAPYCADFSKSLIIPSAMEMEGCFLS